MFYLLCLLVSSWISSTSALAFDVSSKNLGFYGLGTMGEHMAGHLHKLAEEGGGKVRVASRDTEKARRWADARGAIHCDSFDELSKECDVVCMCLSTTDVVEEVLRKCDFLKAGQLLIDCTSGEPERMKVLGEKLSSQGVKLVDSPVSGGPAGAKAGTLTSMLGGSGEAMRLAKRRGGYYTAESDPIVHARCFLTVSDVADAMKVVDAWSGKSVRCGDIGSGDAVKAINNVLNTAHVLLAAEASLVLQKYGVDASIALDVINSR